MTYRTGTGNGAGLVLGQPLMHPQKQSATRAEASKLTKAISHNISRIVSVITSSGVHSCQITTAEPYALACAVALLAADTKPAISSLTTPDCPQLGHQLSFSHVLFTMRPPFKMITCTTCDCAW